MNNNVGEVASRTKPPTPSGTDRVALSSELMLPLRSVLNRQYPKEIPLEMLVIMFVKNTEISLDISVGSSRRCAASARGLTFMSRSGEDGPLPLMAPALLEHVTH